MDKHITAEELDGRLTELYIEYIELYADLKDVKYKHYGECIRNLAESYGIDVTQNGSTFIVCNVCGEGMITPDFTNECECGTLYNFAGQQLRDYDEWLEDWDY